MTKIRWNDWLEGIGIIAIVASLIFVGMQLRQAEKIATAERHAITQSNQIEIGNSIKADANVWKKGASGDELTEDEAAVFAVLVGQVNDSAFYSYLQAFELGGDEEARPAAVDFAIFLYNNPGAESVWLAREKHLVKYRNLIEPDANSNSHWMDMITEYLSILEINGAPIQKTSFIAW